MYTVFNEAEALDRLGDNKDLLLQISAYFVVYAQRQIDELRDAFISDDSERLKFLTHKMLGSISNFGGCSAFEAGSKLQTMLGAKNIEQKDRLTESYQSFMRELEKLRQELATYSSGIEPPEIKF